MEETLEKLRERFSELNQKADWWRVGGAISIALGLLFLVASAVSMNPLDTRIEWTSITYMSLRGALVVAVVGYFANYAASSDRALREEATRIDDRIHAIDYGAFYLKTYGADADWDQVKEAFKDWGESYEITPTKESSEKNSASRRTLRRQTRGKPQSHKPVDKG